MNKSDFERFGVFATGFRCLVAVCAIVQVALAARFYGRLVDPVREWLTDVVVYSMFASLMVLTVSVAELADYKWKSSRQFEKTASIKPSLKGKSYIIIAVIETMILMYYCENLQYTCIAISTEIEIILSAGLAKYSTNRAWQTFWDYFQEHYSCCGSLNSTDWFQTSWISPIKLTSASLLKKYTLNNGKLIIQAAPLSCCLPDSICDTFSDCEQPDPRKYFQKGCFSVISDTINLISFTRYLFYAVIVIQVISTIVKYEGYTTNYGNPESKLFTEEK